MGDFVENFVSGLNKMTPPNIQDKTCRICGAVDTKNLNIFDTKQKSLLYKILTIFPITMYESDPLPKNICKKCTANVALMHEECQKLVKVQQKWVDNVRLNQPDHPYVTVLNIIEETHQEMLRKIKTIAPDFIYKNIRMLQRDFSPQEDDNAANDDDTNLLVPSHSESFTDNEAMYQEVLTGGPLINNFSFDFDITEVKGGNISFANANGVKNEYGQTSGSNKRRRSSIKEIQHKLQSNGCTLLFKSQNDQKPKLSVPNKVRLTVQCEYCSDRFPNQKFLSKHQLQHMTVSDRRIFDRKCLEKKIRRGRLLPVGEKKCIRCLNCWKLFPDNRTILEHWSNGECEFFCQICGMEFANNPKKLREHVPEMHGISYKSSRRQILSIMPDIRIMNRSLLEIKTIQTSVTTTSAVVQSSCPSSSSLSSSQKKWSPSGSKKRKTTPGRVSCSICFCSFPNFQSKNSHMRKHKNETTKLISTTATENREIAVAAATATANAETIDQTIIKTEKESDCEPESEEPYEVLMVLNTNDQRIKIDEDDIVEEKPQLSILENRLNIKKLIELQDPDVSSQQSEQSHLSAVTAPITTNTKSFQLDVISKNKTQTVTIKNTDQDHMQYDKLYNCHPCGKKFSSKTDLFQHKRLCQSNNKFGCRFCLRAFVTSADLQMHIMLMHKGS